MIRNIVFGIMFCAVLSGCGGPSSPAVSDIRSDFEVTELPGVLKLESFSLENRRNTGSDESPAWMARFTAEVSLKEDTFDIDTVEDETRFLKPVWSAGEKFTLYGLVGSEPAGEAWRHSFQLDRESDPTLGRPRSSYGPEALVIGTAEAQAAMAEISRRHEQARIEREARLAADAAQRRRAEEAEQTRRARIEEAVARHQAAFAPDRIERVNLQRGQKRAFLVTAAIEGSGSVWGTDIYNHESDFRKSVVHAGLLAPGETGIVEVMVLEQNSNDFRGSPRNGVNSNNYSKNHRAYQMRLLEKLDDNTD